jgi:hypothetical protein
MTTIQDWSEFTENGFRTLLNDLKSRGYGFVRYGQAFSGRQVLWRHDVDFSVHRAARLAAIEAEEGVVATYFLNPRSIFYHLGEPTIVALVKSILAAGHQVGLHFDASAYDIDLWTPATLETALARERHLVEAILDQPVQAVSWHNPDLSNLLEFDADEIGGLINAYGVSLRDAYVYASDSNGYWRFTPMREVIAAGHCRLHLLTHPEWWPPEPLSPAARVERCVRGRARATLAEYDEFLRRAGRHNLGRDPAREE